LEAEALKDAVNKPVKGGTGDETLEWTGLALSLLPALAMAQSDFDGTWRVDPSMAVSAHFSTTSRSQAFRISAIKKH
jgi:hypothetical protein